MRHFTHRWPQSWHSSPKIRALFPIIWERVQEPLPSSNYALAFISAIYKIFFDSLASFVCITSRHLICSFVILLITTNWSVNTLKQRFSLLGMFPLAWYVFFASCYLRHFQIFNKINSFLKNVLNVLGTKKAITSSKNRLIYIWFFRVLFFSSFVDSSRK